MKKLMTMMAAAVAGVMAWAADPIASTSFESASEFTDGALTLGGVWNCADESAKLLQTAYGEDPQYGYVTGNERYAAFGSDNDNYLKVKTAFGNPVERTFTELNIGDDAVYFDQLVKFTACDEEPSADYSGAKIVIYAKEILDANDEVTGNKLFAVAGKYVNSELSSATYDLGEINIDAWHRLTIKTVKAYNNSAVAFQIFVDGVSIAYTGDKAYDTASSANLTLTSKALNSAKKLLPSLVANANIASIGFDGQGDIDDLMVTTDNPGEWAEDMMFTLNWDANVTGLTYTANGETVTVSDMAAGSVAIAYVPGLTVAVTPTFATNWALDTISGTGCSYDNGVITVTLFNGEATIKTKDVTPRMSVVVDGAEPVTYASFAQALAAINKLESGNVKVTLNQDVTVGVDSEGTTDAIIMTGAAIEIDLAGKTITGAEGANDVIQSASALTISDSSAEKTGKIALAEGNVNAIFYMGSLAVSGGTIDGPVAVVDGQAATSSISGGKFKKGEEAEFQLTLAADYQVAVVEGYWVVSAKPKAGVVLTIANASVEGVEDKAEVSVGDTIEFTVAADEYYENAVVTINGAAAEAQEGTYSYVVTADDVTNSIAINVAATAIVWNITYFDKDEAQFATDTYTIENRAEKQLNAGTLAGYRFVEWQDEDYNEVTSLADMTGDIDLYGIWTAIVYAAQVGENKYETLAEAYAAVQTSEVKEITLLTDVTTGVLKWDASKVDGLVLDLNEKNLVFDIADNAAKYCFQITKGGAVTVKNGNISVANEADKLATIFQNYCDLTVQDVAIDAANLTGANDYVTGAAVFMVMNGNVNITGSTSIANVDGLALSVGNHAGTYPSRSVTIDTTGAIAGDFRFCGGAVNRVNGTIDANAKFYYGTSFAKADANCNAAYVDGEITGFGIVARVGEAPRAAESTDGYYKNLGQLYTTVDAAVAAKQEGDTLKVFLSYAVAATTGDKYDTTIKVGDAEAVAYTEPVTVDWGTPVTVTYTAKTGYQIDEGAEVAYASVVQAETAAAPTVSAIEYTITYNFTGVETEDVEKIVNTNPTSYTIESETITIVAPTCEGYNFNGDLDVTEIAKGSTGDVTVTGSFTKAASRPKAIDDCSDEKVKEAYDTWAKAQGIADPTQANVDAFVLNMDNDATETEMKDTVNAELAALLDAIVASEGNPDLAALEAKYPNADITLEPVELKDSDAVLFKLTIELKK